MTTVTCVQPGILNSTRNPCQSPCGGSHVHTASCTTDCADSANQPTSHSTKAQQGKRTNFTACVGVFIQPRSRVTHSRRSSPTLLTEARPLSSCMSPLPTACLDAQSHSTQTRQCAHCWYTYTYTQPSAQSTMTGATLRPMHTASSATWHSLRCRDGPTVTKGHCGVHTHSLPALLVVLLQATPPLLCLLHRA